MAKECNNTACSKESCEGCPSNNGGKPDFSEPMNKYSNIKKAGAQAENACKIEDRYSSEKDEGHYIYHE